MAAIKTAKEIAIMKNAAETAQSVFARIIEFIRIGATEQEIADKMETFAMAISGVSGLAFPTIIASGPNGAQPHAELTDRKFKRGDFVTVDFGVMMDGYASDMTRTFMIGRPTAKQRKIYKSVQRSQAAGVAAARAGLACAELDRICRNLIYDDGYGDYFIHTTGHGVGTDVHEQPRIGAKSDAVLEAGMIITIEPGIYIEGFGGVRIEDTVLITETGCEVFTPLIPKELILL